MSAGCQSQCHGGGADAAQSPRYRKILWVALLVNLVMFGIEVGVGLRSGSVALLADAIDFFGDAANYGVTLAVLSMGLVWRARPCSRARACWHSACLCWYRRGGW